MLPVTPEAALHEADGVSFYTFPLLDAAPFLRHGFSARLGGVSEGIYRSMNLSFTRGDAPEAVRENFRRFASAVGVRDEDIVISAQTHTTRVLRVGAADRGRGVTRDRGYTDVDGLITDEPGVVLCTQYADCVPLFFVDPVHRAVGTSHSGWKGTAAGMGAETVRRMTEEFGSRPEELLAAVGPSIGPCCFEVDAPVYGVFAALPFTDASCFTEDGGGKYHVDLWEINRRILLAAGLRPEHIAVASVCTRCHPEELWSHRASGGQRGSLAGLIAIAP